MMPATPFCRAYSTGALHSFVRVEILRLHEPTTTRKHERSRNSSRTTRGNKIIAESQSATADFDLRLFAVGAIAPQLDALKISAVITGGFETPAMQIHREKLRGRVEATRRRIASFHFVGSDEGQIISQLRGGDRVDRAQLRDY